MNATETSNAANTRLVLRQDIMAGFGAACVALPTSLASGVLIYVPLGAAYIAQGAVAGLYAGIVAGAVAALAASSSFVITSPLASVSIILAALVTDLLSQAEFSGQPHLIIVAVSLCVLVAGLFQIIFGLLRIGRIITFTPYSVIVGFTNSIGVLIVLSQLRPFFPIGPGLSDWVNVEHSTMLAFVVALASFIVVCGRWFAKIPPPLTALIVGTAIFYGLRALFPELALGETVGRLPTAFPPASPVLDLADASARAVLVSAAPHLLLTALTLAAVATLQSLLAFRLAQNLADLAPRPPRDLIAQGVGNCASAVTGGIIALAAPSQSAISFHAGGRTRLAGLTCATLIFAAAFVFSPVLAGVPVAALNAILLSVGVQLFDRWTFRVFADAVFRRQGVDRRHAWQTASVVATVMVVAVGSSIVAGAIAGVVLSALIFIINMSRPIIRRSYRGDEIFSKRIRSAEDMQVLLGTGRERAILELQGVLFFGNADDLTRVVNETLKGSKVVLLDLRGISDVDVSGATILSNLTARAHQRGKLIAFCNLPIGRLSSANFAEKAAGTFPDLDTGLEWMEEEALGEKDLRSSSDKPVALESLELVRDFDAAEIATLRSILAPRDFAAGTILCMEGDAADRMWILTKGSVSVRLGHGGGQETRRIAGIAAGTTVGEMALLEMGQRSATVTADSGVSSYELTKAAFDTLCCTHPAIALKIFAYFAHEMSYRLRILHRDLRASAN